MALTKADIADQLVQFMAMEEKVLDKSDAKKLVDVFFEEIRLALEQGEMVKLSGFGNFELRDKKQRPGRNPKTGEEIPISPRRVVTFHSGQKLRVSIEQAKTSPGSEDKI